MENINTNSGFQANGVLASFRQGDLAYYLVQYRMCLESGRPALVWLDFKWAKEAVSESKFNELKGDMIIEGNALANNGFFKLK